MPKPAETRAEVPAQARNCYGESQMREIGRTLREARLVRGEDLTQIAGNRLIPTSHLAALEEGTFEQTQGRLYTAALVRSYGDYLGLDGAKLAEPLHVANASLPPPEPKLRKRTGESFRHEAVMMLASLLLAAAAVGAGYHALRPDPGPVEMAAERMPSATGSLPRKGSRRADDAPPAAAALVDVPGPEAVADAAILSGGGSKPSPGDVGEPGPAPTASRSVVAPPIAEAPLVPRAEVSNDDASAVAAEPHAPDGARDHPPNTATALGGDPLASGGDRADLVPSAAPLPVDPGPAGSSPETTISAVKEPITPSRPATVGAPEPSAATAEVTAAPPARPAEAPSAGRFVVYFFSVRPSARVVSEWQRLTERHPDLAGLELQTPRPIDVPGKSTLYAVEAGAFATRAEAQAICDRLRPRGQRCRVLAR